ncbi:molybdopterin-dependent oxidoreductase [Streptomyces tricolor]|nr:molybdopterin-dependent oxidoreductase [Streptomyces tricolor]
MADCHPILFLRMMERVRSAGARLIVVGPRRTATADRADPAPADPARHRPGPAERPAAPAGRERPHRRGVHRRVHRGLGADARVPRGLPAREGRGDHRHTESDIRRAARWIGEAGAWMSCWTMGLNQSTHGTWNTNALVNLHLATGALCRPGAGPFSLTGQPQRHGRARDGLHGPRPARTALGPGRRRPRLRREAVEPPEAPCAAMPGRGTVEMFERMAAGAVKACWIICTNPVASVANRRTVIAGLEGRRTRHRPGRVRRDRDQRLRRCGAAGDAVGRVRRRQATTPSATSPSYPGSWTRRARRCPTGS